MSDLYSILGISPSASSESVKLAFRKKANLLHPDKNASPDAAARFREVREAYATLSDPAKRKGYDDFRQRSLLDDPLATAGEIWESYCTGVVT